MPPPFSELACSPLLTPRLPLLLLFPEASASQHTSVPQTKTGICLSAHSLRRPPSWTHGVVRLSGCPRLITSDWSVIQMPATLSHPSQHLPSLAME